MKIDVVKYGTSRTFDDITDACNVITSFHLSCGKFLGWSKWEVLQHCYDIVDSFNYAMRRPPIIDRDTRYVHVDFREKNAKEIK